MSPILGIYASQITGHLNPFTPTGSYDALASYTVPSGGVSSIEFAGLPTGGQYTHLQLRITAASGTNQTAFRMTINGDTTDSNYRYHLFGGDGSIATQTANGRNMGVLRNSTYFSGTILDVVDYSSTNKYKTFRCLSGVDQSSAGFIAFSSNLWMNTNSITSIKLEEYSGTNFLEYSQFSIYGVKG
jgi:hypothetical protein